MINNRYFTKINQEKLTLPTTDVFVFGSDWDSLYEGVISSQNGVMKFIETRLFSVREIQTRMLEALKKSEQKRKALLEIEEWE